MYSPGVSTYSTYIHIRTKNVVIKIKKALYWINRSQKNGNKISNPFIPQPLDDQPLDDQPLDDT